MVKWLRIWTVSREIWIRICAQAWCRFENFYSNYTLSKTVKWDGGRDDSLFSYAEAQTNVVVHISCHWLLLTLDSEKPILFSCYCVFVHFLKLSLKFNRHFLAFISSLCCLPFSLSVSVFLSTTYDSYILSHLFSKWRYGMCESIKVTLEFFVSLFKK